MQEETPQARQIAQQIHYYATNTLRHEVLTGIKDYLAQNRARHGRQALKLLASHDFYEDMPDNPASRVEHRLIQALAEHIIFSVRADGWRNAIEEQTHV